MDAAEAATTGTWTGEKETKIQRDGDLGRIAKQSDKIVHVGEHEQDWLKEIEEFDWDYNRLKMAIDHYVNQLHHSTPYYDMEIPDDQQLKELMSRLAMYRIRAYRGDELKGLDEDQLGKKYHLPILKEQGYYKWCEHGFEWFFDPETFDYVGLEDYQRLMLRNNIDFKEALKQLSAEDMPVSSSIHMEAELSKDQDPSIPGPVTHNFEEHVARPLIMEAAMKIASKPKMYYDYAKKKLKISEEIGVIAHQSKQKI